MKRVWITLAAAGTFALAPLALAEAEFTIALTGDAIITRPLTRHQEPAAARMIELIRSADVVVGHGPHLLRGVEIYNGKPILYSLGNFIYQADGIERLPDENYQWLDLGPEATVKNFVAKRDRLEDFGPAKQGWYWESVIAVVHWRWKELRQLQLHPIVLGFGEPIGVRGRPCLAGPAVGERVIRQLQDHSDRFGTTIRFQDGLGIVELP